MPFHHGSKPTLGFEMFRLSELLDRADSDALGHELETPQRPEFHIVYVGLRGRGDLIVDFAPVPLGTGFLTFVAQGRVQHFSVTRAVDAWMLLVEPSLVGLHADDPLRTLSVLSPAWARPALAIPAVERREVMSLVEQMAAEQARPQDSVQQGILAALLRALLLRAERLRASRELAPSGALVQFFTILERDHARTRSVAHYSRAAGVSSRRLGELLVERMGKSTKQVIDERVVLEQKRLLAFTELSVKELAEATGFEEPTNLVKFFRHHTGQTPLAFRASQRTFLPSSRGSAPRRGRRDG